MKTVALLVAASLFALSAVHAQDSRPPKGAAPPPPGMNDPGVQPTAPASSGPKGSARALPAMHEDTAADARHLSIPQVSVHRDGTDRVQEYRRHGQLYMVVVTPEHGVPYSYTVDPDGSRHLDPSNPPVHPAMYKVLEWGKPAAPATASSAPATDGGGH